MATQADISHSIAVRGRLRRSHVDQIARRTREDKLTPTNESRSIPIHLAPEHVATLILAVATSKTIADAGRNALKFGQLKAGSITLHQTLTDIIREARGGDDPFCRFIDIRIDLDEPSATAIERNGSGIITSQYTPTGKPKAIGQCRARKVIELPFEVLLMIAIDFHNAK